MSAIAACEWLVDTSAPVHLPMAPDAALWAERIERSLVRIGTLTRLELRCSAGPE